MYAEERLKAEIAKDIIAKSDEANSVMRTGLQGQSGIWREYASGLWGAFDQYHLLFL